MGTTLSTMHRHRRARRRRRPLDARTRRTLLFAGVITTAVLFVGVVLSLLILVYPEHSFLLAPAGKRL